MLKFIVKNIVILAIYCLLSFIGMIYCFSYGIKTPSQLFVKHLILFPFGYFTNQDSLWFLLFNSIFWSISFQFIFKILRNEQHIDLLDD